MAEANGSEEDRVRLQPVEDKMLTGFGRERLRKYDCTSRYIDSVLGTSANFNDLAETYEDMIEVKLGKMEDIRAKGQNYRAARDKGDGSLLMNALVDDQNFMQVIDQSLGALPFADDSGVYRAVANYKAARTNLMFSARERQREKLSRGMDPSTTDLLVLENARLSAKQKFMNDFKAALLDLQIRVKSDSQALSATLKDGTLNRQDRDSLVSEAVQSGADTLAKSDEEKKALCYLRKRHGEGAQTLDNLIAIGFWGSMGYGKLAQVSTKILSSTFGARAAATSGVAGRSVAAQRGKFTLGQGTFAGANAKIISDLCMKKFKEIGITTAPTDKTDGVTCELYSTRLMDAVSCGVAVGFAGMQAKSLSTIGTQAINRFLDRRGYKDLINPMRLSGSTNETASAAR